MSDGKTVEIEFRASVEKVQTMADGGIRLTLNMPEDSILQMAQLAECQRWGVYLSVSCKTGDNQGVVTDERRKVATGSKRKSTWAAQES